MKRMGFNIDVVSACNLKCPSCPVGNSEDVTRSKGIMASELLEEILKKASNECEIEYIGLVNWAEPLIHPRVSELIEIAQSHAPCTVSSNLNFEKINFESILKSEPTLFRISLSGFNQSVYSRTHRGGNIELVKKNMRRLSDAAARLETSTEIEVFYHRYLGNADDELLTKNFCDELGFSFRPVWAYLMPIEKVLEYVDDPGRVSPQDRELVSMLALPPGEEVIKASQAVKSKGCSLLDDQITITSQGVVQLCCGVFDEEKYSICGYLENPLQEVQEMKRGMSICQECMSHGIHNLALYKSPEYDAIAKSKVLDHYRALINMERPSIMSRFKRRVRRMMNQ